MFVLSPVCIDMCLELREVSVYSSAPSPLGRDPIGVTWYAKLNFKLK